MNLSILFPISCYWVRGNPTVRAGIPAEICIYKRIENRIKSRIKNSPVYPKKHRATIQERQNRDPRNDGPTNPVDVYHSPLVENGNPGRETNEGDQRNAGHRVGDVPANVSEKNSNEPCRKRPGKFFAKKSFPRVLQRKRSKSQ